MIMKNRKWIGGAIAGVLFCWLPFNGVVKAQTPRKKAAAVSVDQNAFQYELSIEEFNKSTTGVLVDGYFIKSLIGLNLDSLTSCRIVTDGPLVIKGVKGENDSIMVGQKGTKSSLVNINGVDYTRFVCVSFGKHVEFLSLDDIRKAYFPQIGDAPCIYMVNKFLLMNDLSSYKIDKNFILDVELLRSTDIEGFEALPQFYVVCITTKTRDNLKYYNKKRSRLR